ncbi:MAG: hypothetical protein JRJ84_16950 [Deltaproteobacteria bacterium]|nr:hypothetical protein [Deltaproteobacteria bacterium]
MRQTALATSLLLLSGLLAAPAAQALPGQMWVGSASSGDWESSYVRPLPAGFDWLDPSWELELSILHGEPSAELTEVHAPIPTIPALNAHLRRGTLVFVSARYPGGGELFAIEPTGDFDASLDDLSWWFEEAGTLWDEGDEEQLADGATITRTLPTVGEKFGELEASFDSEKAGDWDALMNFEFSDGDPWILVVSDGTAFAKPGWHKDATSTVQLDSTTFVALFSGWLTVEEAWTTGKITADNLGDLLKLQSLCRG